LLELLRNERVIRTTLTPGPNEEEKKMFMIMQAVWGKFLSGETVIPIWVEKENSEKDKK